VRCVEIFVGRQVCEVGEVDDFSLHEDVLYGPEVVGIEVLSVGVCGGDTVAAPLVGVVHAGEGVAEFKDVASVDSHHVSHSSEGSLDACFEGGIRQGGGSSGQIK